MGSPREIDAIADRYVAECLVRYPETATELGHRPEGASWSDLSPAGVADRVGHLRRTVSALHAAVPADPREHLAKEVMLERLGVELELYDAHITQSRIAVTHGPTQRLRAIFDLMPTDTAEDWQDVAERLRTVDQPLRGLQETLLDEAREGNVSAARQVRGNQRQIRGWTGETGDDDFFAGLVARAAAHPEVDDGLREAVRSAADDARRCFGEFADWLGAELLPRAPGLDAVGEERYTLDARSFLGASLDLEETYRWGFEELYRIQQEQRLTARELTGDEDIRAAYAALDADPARQLHGAAAFRDWMQELSDGAVAALAGTEFDIPEPLRRLECRLAPTHDGVIYYTDPTEDFRRPGRMWWSVPTGIDTFSTWKEVTTVYHEGVPGHHLQVGGAAYQTETLNRWQRTLGWVAGHGEGWALYAERLMDDLGFLEPGERMGMLDSQAFRAVRVVVDIGMHLQLPIPRDNPWRFRPGERWTAASGLEFLSAHYAADEPYLRFEIDRYLGWPGQALSYKVGERVWREAATEARRRGGDGYDRRAFHAAALGLGPMGLDRLRAELDRL